MATSVDLSLGDGISVHVTRPELVAEIAATVGRAITAAAVPVTEHVASITPMRLRHA